jgi:hypothetical protein
LGGVGGFFSGREFSMNDNGAPPAHDRLIGRVLADTVVVEEHLTKGLPAMLSASGIVPEFQEAVQTFIAPVIKILADLESDVIQYTREQRTEELLMADTLDGTMTQLEAWADTFGRLANSPQQLRAAAGFREFVEEFTGRGKDMPEIGKEPKGKDFERD